MLRRATARQLDEALDALAESFAEGDGDTAHDA
jgi:hypothetical protein